MKAQSSVGATSPEYAAPTELEILVVRMATKMPRRWRYPANQLFRGWASLAEEAETGEARLLAAQILILENGPEFSQHLMAEALLGDLVWASCFNWVHSSSDGLVAIGTPSSAWEP